MANIAVLNTTADLLSKTIITRENPYTITGLLTFDRDPSAPFAVSANSAVVTNLDADKLDGIEASAMAKLASTNTFTTFQVINGAAANTTALTLQTASTTLGGLVATGFYKGTGATDLGIYSETGKNIELMPGGSATSRYVFGPNGFSSPAITHAGGNNCDVGAALVVNFTGTPTGIANPTDGRILFCLNNSGADIVLPEEDVLSTAANRFGTAVGGAYVWLSNHAILLVYNGSDSRWAVVSGA